MEGDFYQVKHWKTKVGPSVVDETLKAQLFYRAHVPVIVSLNGFDNAVREHQHILLSRGIPLQLVDRHDLETRAKRLHGYPPNRPSAKPYQEPIIQAIVKNWEQEHYRALVVMATGLGKTVVTAESIRRINSLIPIKVLILAHTNELVYQLERAFWPFLTADQRTIVWNGYESPDDQAMEDAAFVFACHRSVADHLNNGSDLPSFDVMIVDECHHIGGQMYLSILDRTSAGTGKPNPFLLGLTATPWRPDDLDLTDYFGTAIATLDMVTALRNGYLSNVDYRMHTDNIDWKMLTRLRGRFLSPRYINRTLFISEWNDSVVHELRRTWNEIQKPRAIVFCGTIDHAITMRDRINSLGFCRAAAIYSQTGGGHALSGAERQRILCDFGDGEIQVLCAVDILNEGIDVPDVNIIVFQRVTHSRRIFVQQLGRGLRLSPGKEKVIVLDFVSDIRRFAAGLELKDALNQPRPVGPVYVRLNHKVAFRRVDGDDPQSESFLRQWLDDVAAIQAAGDDASVLKFPPSEIGRAK